jgi:DNA-binding NtrC family response regulator
MTAGLQARSIPTTGTFRVLVCTGDRGAESELGAALAPRGGEVRVVTDAETFHTACTREGFDAVFVDLPASPDARSAWREEIAVHGVDGIDVVLAVPVDREDIAKRAIGRSAVAYVTKPCTFAQAAAMLGIAAENRKLRRRLQALEAQLDTEEEQDELIGCSPAMRRLTTAVSRAGGNDATVLIEGKPGVGKTLVARMVHGNGRRGAAPLEVVPCDQVDDALLEAAFEAAQGGTLLLEDVDRLSPRAQSRLVRFLKESGSGARKVRIIATTSARLAELVAKGSVREDLYYRLNMFPVVVPTLAERREDVPLLAQAFLKTSTRRTGLPDRGFTPAAMIMLEAHPWPGNVGQLRNAIVRAHALADGGAIDRVHLFGPSTGVHPPPNVIGLTDPIGGETDEDVTESDILPFQEEEKRLLSRALRATHGNVRRAAQLLGIGRATLYRKIQIYKLTMN